MAGETNNKECNAQRACKPDHTRLFVNDAEVILCNKASQEWEMKYRKTSV
jgi:hypothetical protein